MEIVCRHCLAWQHYAVDTDGRPVGRCMRRPELKLISDTYPICDLYVPREGSPSRAAATRKTVGAPRGERAPAAEAPSTRRPPPPARVDATDPDALRAALVVMMRELFEEEGGGEELELVPRFAGGRAELRAADGTLLNERPIEDAFARVTAVRDAIATLDAKLAEHALLTEAEKSEMRGYLTKINGSFTTFNILFRDQSKRFIGDKKSDGD